MNPIASFWKMLRLLTFQSRREELTSFTPMDFAVGLTVTWLVGMGRYWDDPDALLIQHLGLGSVIYIFVLAYFIWILLRPFKIENWSYMDLLTFISFTSLPAALYAVPVERYYDIETAAWMNALFLLFVAAWRVALLIFYLSIFARLRFGEVLVATMLPLTAIVTVLSVLNLERAAFDLMGGIRERASNDPAYEILNALTSLSMFLLIPMLIGYFVIIANRSRKK